MGRREFDMKKYVILCVAVLLVSSTTVFSEDRLPPGWRGLPGTTLQVWEFDDDNTTPAPDSVYNPYDNGPFLQVDTPYSWFSETGDPVRDGWALGELDIYIPNDPEPRPEKRMRIQLTWKVGDNPSLFTADMPVIGVTPFLDMTMTVVESIQLGYGWETLVLDVVMHPNPPEEWVTIKGNILVDELVIDTYCVPEPMTMALLGFGGLVLYRRRRG